MHRKDALGRYGEELAARHLADSGLAILERNYRCESGEIDIVARDGDVLVVCEVKTRAGLAFGAPIEAVTATKARRLRVLACQWLADHRGVRPATVRFDVVGVLSADGGQQLARPDAVRRAERSRDGAQGVSPEDERLTRFERRHGDDPQRRRVQEGDGRLGTSRSVIADGDLDAHEFRCDVGERDVLAGQRQRSRDCDGLAMLQSKCHELSLPEVSSRVTSEAACPME